MKRSTINAILRDAEGYFREQNFQLPPFAYWTPKDWRHKGPEVSEIVNKGLGWDITDYGLGDFKRYGLLLFTIRNGSLKAWQQGKDRPYAEKIMIAEADQQHQMHFHWKKVEDIINRAGGRLAIQLYNSTPDNELADTDVTVLVDGVLRTLKAGEVVVLRPGESITLPTRLYHKFWAEGSRVMMGEVSTVNDDYHDNLFYKPIGTGRFSEIEADEPPLYPLFNDYHKYWNGS